MRRIPKATKGGGYRRSNVPQLRVEVIPHLSLEQSTAADHGPLHAVENNV